MKLFLLCALLLTAGYTQTVSRRLDEWGAFQTDKLEDWVLGKVDAQHALNVLTYGEHGWVAFASSSIPSPDGELSPQRWFSGSFDQTLDWVKGILRSTTMSISTIAYGDEKWFAFADRNTVNAGEFHAVHPNINKFVDWVRSNIKTGCYPTNFAFGNDLFYGICSTKPTDEPVDFFLSVFKNHDDMFDAMNEKGKQGYSAVALENGNDVWLLYMEKSDVNDVWASIRGESPVEIFDWISKYARDEKNKYDLSTLTYSRTEKVWVGWMSTVDPDLVALESTCSIGCPNSWVGDGICDQACKNNNCNQDGGDCEVSPDDEPAEEECAPGCPISLSTNDVCDPACLYTGCGFDNGACECAPGCITMEMVGDGKCDALCNVNTCAFDGDDCITETTNSASETPNGRSTGGLVMNLEGVSEDVVGTPIHEALVKASDATAKIWNKVVTTRQEPIMFKREVNLDQFHCKIDHTFEKGEKLEAFLTVFVRITQIDGPRGIRARAGPCILDKLTGLPRFGVLEIDEGDLGTISGDEIFTRVLMHEVGHVLGIGSLWDDSLILNSGTTDPKYVGRHGHAGFLKLGGTGYPNIANVGGKGTYGVHWRESDFGSELMTGTLSSNSQPLSVMSVLSLMDLGYQVDKTAVEEYNIEQARVDVIKESIGTYGDDTLETGSTVRQVMDEDGYIYIRRDGKDTLLKGVDGQIPAGNIAIIVIASVGLVGVLGYTGNRMRHGHGHEHDEEESSVGSYTGDRRTSSVNLTIEPLGRAL